MIGGVQFILSPNQGMISCTSRACRCLRTGTPFYNLSGCMGLHLISAGFLLVGVVAQI